MKLVLTLAALVASGYGGHPASSGRTLAVITWGELLERFHLTALRMPECAGVWQKTQVDFSTWARNLVGGWVGG